MLLCLVIMALKRVPYTSEQEVEVGSIWAKRNILYFWAKILSSVFSCRRGIVWSWTKYKLMLSQYNVFIEIKVTVSPYVFVISVTVRDCSGYVVGSTWWSGKYSLFPGAVMRVIFKAESNLPSTKVLIFTTLSAVFSHSLCAEKSPVIIAASTFGKLSLMYSIAESKSLTGASHLLLPYYGAWVCFVSGKPCSAWQQIGKSHTIEAF